MAVLVFGVILIRPQLIAAQESYEYQAVLDGACPRSFIGRGDDEVLSLRFVPFEKPEVQINIRFREKEAPKIEVCRAVGRSILLPPLLCAGFGSAEPSRNRSRF